MGELDGEVREEDELGAVPLLLGRRDLALLGRPVVAGRGGRKRKGGPIASVSSGTGERQAGQRRQRTGCSFHLLKYEMRSMMTNGRQRPK